MTDPEDLLAICPICASRIPLDDFKEQGFLRARRRREGGPYYELTCSGCRSVLTLEQAEDRSRSVSLKTSGWFGLRPPGDSQSFPPEDPGDGPKHRHAGASRPGSRPGGGDDAGGHENDSDFGEGFASFNAGREERDEREREGGRSDGARDERDTQMAVERCREILGVDSHANEEVILAAFRERSKQIHPDRFQAFDEDFRSLAHEKFIELKRARDRLLAIIERSGDRGSRREKN